MGWSTIIFGNSESQASKGEEGKFVWRRKDSFYIQFLGNEGEVEGWEEHRPYCAWRQPLLGCVLCCKWGLCVCKTGCKPVVRFPYCENDSRARWRLLWKVLGKLRVPEGPQLRIHGQPSALGGLINEWYKPRDCEQWRGYIPWVVRVVGKRERWRIGTIMGVEPRFWGWCVWRVDNQWVGSPCGFIASTRGWPTVERKWIATLMAGRFILRM